MAQSLCTDLLLTESGQESPGASPDPAVCQDLIQLAFATDSLPDRSRTLYGQLRKMIGQPRLVSYLHGLQELVRQFEPAGARLLAAFLDANTPGARLIPRIHSLSSTRRVRIRMGEGEEAAGALRTWVQHLRDLEAQCLGREDEIPGARATPSGRPGSESPYPLMRRCLRHFVATLYRQGSLPPADNSLLADLARLEVDAYQERISQLAGEIDPFRVSAVVKVLPLLSRADAEIRDLREFISWLEAGQVEKAFHERVPRSHEVLEEKERSALARVLFETGQLAPLAELQDGLLRNAIPVPQLAVSAARLMALAHHLKSEGARQTELDLLTAIRIIQLNERNGELSLALDEALRETVAAILAAPAEGDGLAAWPLTGFAVEKGRLVLRLPPVSLGDRVWRDDLPLPAESDQEVLDLLLAEVPANEREAMEALAVKRLVLNNIGSVSVLVGFLRNPKIVGIPGLVASVVTRCRSVNVLEMVATTRDLYCGYANQEVPLALLSSPCNIPVKTLRKFIHVKYVSRVDLQRLARDKTTFRDEVVKEIKSYLRSISQ